MRAFSLELQVSIERVGPLELVQFDDAARRLALSPAQLLDLVASWRIEALVPFDVFNVDPGGAPQWKVGANGDLDYDQDDWNPPLPRMSAGVLMASRGMLAVHFSDAPALRALAGDGSIGVHRLTLPKFVKHLSGVGGEWEWYAHRLGVTGDPRFMLTRALLWVAEHELTSLGARPPATLPVLDPEHERAAPELLAAVAAWEGVILRGEGPRKGTTKQKLVGWLKQRRPDLGEGARERIAIVANPDKSGGAPKSG